VDCASACPPYGRSDDQRRRHPEQGGEILDETPPVGIRISRPCRADLLSLSLPHSQHTIDEDRALQLGNRAQTLPPAPPNEYLVSIDAAQADADGFGRLAALLAQIDLIPEREDAYDPLAWDEHGLPQ